MRLRLLAAVLFACYAFATPVWAAAKLVTPAPGQVNLGALVTATGTITIPSPATAPRELDLKAFPRLQTFEDPQLGLAAVAGDVAHLLDPAGARVVASVAGKEIGTVWSIPGQSDVLLAELAASNVHLVRRERATGREIWRVPLGDRWNFNYMTGTGLGPLTVYEAPWRTLWSSSAGRMTLIGLEERTGEQDRPKGTAKTGRIWSRVLSLDLSTGTVISDERFDFERLAVGVRRWSVAVAAEGKSFDLEQDVLGQPLLLLNVNQQEASLPEGGGSFKLISVTGDTLMTGQLASGDLPLEFKRVQPRHFSWYTRWDLQPLLVGPELWLCGRNLTGDPYGTVHGLRADTWTRFDQQGRRLGRVGPALRSAPDYIVRNVGVAPWPIVLAQVVDEACGGGGCVDGLVFVAEDGTFSSRSLLGPNGERLRYADDVWFHEGDQVYFLNDGALYRSVAGERTAVVVVPAPADEKFKSVPLVRNGFAVLVGKKKSTVVSLHDGSIAPRSGQGAEFVSHLWSVADAYLWDPGAGALAVRQGLPMSGLPPEFKRYSEGIAHSSLGTVTELRSHDYPYPRLKALQVWGEDDRRGVVLVPAELKSGQAILVGVEWPSFQVAFWLPIAALKGLGDEKPPGGSPYPYLVYRRTASEAALAVLEDSNRIALYTIRRPGAAVQAQQP